jgi:cyclopropane-fatty-acyl-phospholipid synthase
MNDLAKLALELTEHGFVPDSLVRRGIRRLLKQRLQEIHADSAQAAADRFDSFLAHMKTSAVAVLPEKANEQHYEVPAECFEHTLGPRLKYSCAYWPPGVSRLADAEVAALAETCANAQIADGQRILELGCGWGSLSLWIAAKHPSSHITAVSNSRSQREFIESQARAGGLDNLLVITSDMNDFDHDPGQFDRVVSVEMFEHMRNWAELYAAIARWLKPGGRFFKHIFVHRASPYLFEDNGPSDWMSRHFFSGGMMPGDDLPLAFQEDLRFVRRWRWDGTHYEKTANAWLDRMDGNRDVLWPVFRQTYGEADVRTWWNRWRVFYMACAELFGYERGQRWWVSHYLFEKPIAAPRALAA